MTDHTDSTLRELAKRACKKVYIGTAVLPKPLFVLDHDDDEIDSKSVSFITIQLNCDFARRMLKS
jgi:hypothetical protein